MSAAASVRLLDADPDLGRLLGQEELQQASQLFVPVLSLPRGSLDAERTLRDMNGFGAILLEGMLLAQLQIGEHAVVRLLGPGDHLALSSVPPSTMVAFANWRATTKSRIALLDNRVLQACRRWPGLIAGLHSRMADQQERVVTQLAICQLPRVEERLLAILWLLAESWGRVTRAGTALPLSLTHDVLGALVGARRPTVTLALGQLVRSGAILQQQDGWLLLEWPGRPTEPAGEVLDAAPVQDSASPWVEATKPGERAQNDWVALLANVTRLRAEHEQRVARLQEQLHRTKSTRLAQRRERVRNGKEPVPRRRRSTS